MSIRDELTIAREIVINDTEASLRHKLTINAQVSTQEEIQRSTGAVGKVSSSKLNALPDGEKPLYICCCPYVYYIFLAQQTLITGA
ncbi:unnamed protein product [Eruca vesicaria subsp. sativa]|uniref:ATP-dependent RNA helicase PRP5/DDX46/KHDC4 KH domain-containing protein n=1 Tax=Eruca vesicaria subsp. sativa TaxID=29727 RepID=A0ABC8M2K8_ERUVS|nr:unnamed protein product [Eruca vesicaria subsp. sativa]